jgi:L,D-transpeptidase ErfK/SrfK
MYWRKLLAFSLILLVGAGVWAAGREIVINLPMFTLSLYEDGQLLRAYPIAVGRVVAPTRLGETIITNKVVDPTYYPPQWYAKGLEPIPPGPDNPVGTRWLGLGFPGYGIHGTNEPGSIGKAVSQGCIRMHNSDVEELADLVSVGTPVRFIYETIQVGLDPSTGQPHIIVYPDIYRLKTNTLSRALAKLSPFRLDGEIHEGALQALLARPTGKWTSIPIQVRVCWEGAPLDEVGYRLGEEIMVPLEPLMLKTGRKVHGLERRRAGGTWYGAATDVAGALGLGLELQEGTPDFYQVSLLVGDEALARETFIYRGELYVAVEELARRLGIPLAWDRDERRLVIDRSPVDDFLIIDHRAYLSRRQLRAHLGVWISWQEGDRKAELIQPKVFLDGEILTEESFLGQGGALVPLQPLAGKLGLALSWDGQQGAALLGRDKRLPGVIRKGRIFVSPAMLAEALPMLGVSWQEERQELHLFWNGEASVGEPLLQESLGQVSQVLLQ